MRKKYGFEQRGQRRKGKGRERGERGAGVTAQKKRAPGPEFKTRTKLSAQKSEIVWPLSYICFFIY
jgi:hypothetical protein